MEYITGGWAGEEGMEYVTGGWRVLRFTWRDQHPDRVIASVRRPIG